MQFRKCQRSSRHKKVKIIIGNKSRKDRWKKGAEGSGENGRHLRYVKVREVDGGGGIKSWRKIGEMGKVMNT